jgi:hypothetical protein
MQEREKYGLIDYDERMAIMIQPLVGEQHGRYFFPTIVGLGFSENPFHQEMGVRKEDGFLRLVWGFASRITGEQFKQQSCILALGRPHKKPGEPESSLVQANQETIKVINLETNQFETIPVSAVLDGTYSRRDYVTSLPGPTPAITFNKLTQDAQFIKLMRNILHRLQTIYEKPVELEFTLQIQNTVTGPRYQIYILQCHTSPIKNLPEGVEAPGG